MENHTIGDFFWGYNAWQNYFSELIGAVFIAVVTSLFYKFIWKKKIRDDFHNDMIPILREIADKRLSEKISEDTAQDLVCTIADNLGRKQLESGLFEKYRVKSNEKCSICGKSNQAAQDERCKKCRLNLSVWLD